MPRKAREKSKSGIYHVVIRGNNGQNIFFDEEDKQEFLNTLFFCRQTDGFLLFAYALFDEHAHFIIREESVNVANILKHITTKYVRWHNKKHGEHGRLLHDRYLSEPVDTEEDLMRSIRYVTVHGQQFHGTQSFDVEPWNSYKEYKDLNTDKVESDIIFGLLADESEEGAMLFKAFLGLKSQDEFIDIGTERIMLSDDRIRDIVIEKYGIEDGSLEGIEKERQTEILRELKSINGISIRRLARATGLTKFVVEKA